MHNNKSAFSIYCAALMFSLAFSSVPARGQSAGAPAFWGQDLFIGGRGAYHTYRIPAMVVTTKGTILAFCEGRRSSSHDWGAIDTLLRRSTDGGRTWGPILRVHGIDEGRVTIGNPVPIVDRQTGDVHLLLCEDGKNRFTRFPSKNHDHALGLRRAWHCTGHQGDWTWTAGTRECAAMPSNEVGGRPFGRISSDIRGRLSEAMLD